MAHFIFIQFLQFFIFTNLFIATVICNGQSDLLTDEEIYQIFNTDRKSAPNYGIIKMAIRKNRHKRSSGETWELPVKFSNGSTIILNLYKTSGTLANHHTPIWFAEGGEWEDRSVRYIRDPMGMNRFDKFIFYQDYTHRAAIVLFTADNTIEGFVEYYELGRVTPERSPNNRGSRYVKYVLKESIKQNKISSVGKRLEKLDPTVLRPNGPPKIVFPELLIVLDRDYVRKGIAQCLRKLVAYFNAVDMLFSVVRSPQIKLNIAGIIIPIDSLTTPWTAKKYRLGKKVLNGTSSLMRIGDHFFQYQDEFPPDNYDFIITFTSGYLIDAEGFLVFGAAFTDVPCSDLKHRIAIINYSDNAYDTGAHEIGHLFSAVHDEENECKSSNGIMNTGQHRDHAHLSWSPCSLDSFSLYFSKKESTCLDKCPKTVRNCPAPGDLCAENFESYCNKLSAIGVQPFVSCENNVMCAPRNEFVWIFMSNDGAICESKFDNPTRICYQNKCVPYEPFQDVCSH